MKISPSQIRTYLDCNFAAYVRYVEKLEPIGQASKFAFGKAAHALLDPALRIHWASGGSEAAVLDAMSGETGKTIAREAFAAAHEEDGTIIDDETAARALEVVRWNLARMQLDEWETLTVRTVAQEPVRIEHVTAAVELTLECDLIPGVTLQGRIDWIALHRRSQQVFVIDHKTTGLKFDSTKLVEHDLQLALYRHLCGQNGIEVDGAMINIMRDKIPSAPKPNKTKGGMSRSNISTTWEIYREAVLANGYDPADYDDQRERYEGAMFRGYFRDLSNQSSRYHAVNTASRVAKLRLLQHAPLGEMERPFAVGPTPTIPNRRPTRDCEGCDYKAWCDATFDGHAPGSLVGTVYLAKDGSRWQGDSTIYTADAFNDFEDRAVRRGRFAHSVFTP